MRPCPPGIKLAFAPIDARRQPHALAVKAGERGGGGAAGGQSVGLIYSVDEPLPQARELPAPELVVDGRTRRKAPRQAAPLATNSAGIAHDVKNLAKAVATFAVYGQQQSHNLPLRVSKGLIALNHKANRSPGTPPAAC